MLGVRSAPGEKHERVRALPKAIFLLTAGLCLLPLLPLGEAIASWSAPVALVAGTLLALTLGNPFPAPSKIAAKGLLQASVVLLGFSMDLGKVVQAGRSGLGFSLASIVSVFGLGWLLGRALKIRPATGLLISAGTAICGGSAIAAVGSTVDAPEEDVSVAVGTVFLLNALALVIFPPLGHRLGLSQHQFGVWSGISIHDIASVVGAGSAYGPEALDVATAVKLSRVLYLVPVTVIAAAIHARRSTGGRNAVPIPWFAGGFLLASASRSFLPAIVPFAGDVKRLASAGFALSLFLIGTALTRQTLKSVGIRPLALGAALWVFVSVASLIAVQTLYAAGV